MNHKELLAESVAMLRDRGADYGDENALYERVCLIYNLMTGEQLTPWHAAIFMTALKMARIRTSAQKLDNYVDGVNYLAFAGQFAEARSEKIRPTVPIPVEIEEQVDEDIKRMAEMFAPVKVDNPDA
jgi:hypothetical protein